MESPTRTSVNLVKVVDGGELTFGPYTLGRDANDSNWLLEFDNNSISWSCLFKTVEYIGNDNYLLLNENDNVKVCLESVEKNRDELADILHTISHKRAHS